MALNGIGGMNTVVPLTWETNKVQEDEKTVGFADYLKDALDKTNSIQLESDRVADDFAAGRTDNIHQVMITAEKADIALQFTLQIRNKLLDAYNEIMRIQV